MPAPPRIGCPRAAGRKIRYQAVNIQWGDPTAEGPPPVIFTGMGDLGPKPAASKLASVFDYLDYRELLRDRFASRKAIFCDFGYERSPS